MFRCSIVKKKYKRGNKNTKLNKFNVKHEKPTKVEIDYDLLADSIIKGQQRAEQEKARADKEKIAQARNELNKKFGNHKVRQLLFWKKEDAYHINTNMVLMSLFNYMSLYVFKCFLYISSLFLFVLSICGVYQLSKEIIEYYSSVQFVFANFVYKYGIDIMWQVALLMASVLCLFIASVFRIAAFNAETENNRENIEQTFNFLLPTISLIIAIVGVVCNI